LPDGDTLGNSVGVNNGLCDCNSLDGLNDGTSDGGPVGAVDPACTVGIDVPVPLGLCDGKEMLVGFKAGLRDGIRCEGVKGTLEGTFVATFVGPG
jgi:hypothetical protein